MLYLFNRINEDTNTITLTPEEYKVLWSDYQSIIDMFNLPLQDRPITLWGAEIKIRKEDTNEIIN